MKNFTKLMGIIAVVAVIGFGMVACGDGGGDTPYGSGGGGGGTAKQITITGITGKTGNAYIAVIDGNVAVASAKGSISGNAVTFNLVSGLVLGIGFGSGQPWTGSGAYYLNLGFVENEYEYFYLNGTTEEQKYTISSPTSTIPFSKFGQILFGPLLPPDKP